MKMSFSTLACPEWGLEQVLAMGARERFDGVELRFLNGEDSLWKLPEFQKSRIRETRAKIADSGLLICCVDTSCRFDSGEKLERERWVEEGVRMADLAQQLGAPGIRVFGDRIPPGSDREGTQTRIADSLNKLIARTAASGADIWLETHGDFSRADDVKAILATCPTVALVWDPVSAFVEADELPAANGLPLRSAVRHVHIKDVRKVKGKWLPVLTSTGDFPLGEVQDVVEQINYAGWLSFEWEKKWHPEIEPPEVAIPHFANWFRREWQKLHQPICDPGVHA